VVITYTTANNHTSTLSVANSAGTDMFRVQDDGEALFKAANNSPQAFQIQNSSGSNLVSADTTNWRVYVGPTAGDTVGALLVLGNKTTSGDPTGVAGAMYYNSNWNAFRCYQNGAWANCVMNGAAITEQGLQEDEFTATGGTSGPWTCATLTAGGTNPLQAVTAGHYGIDDVTATASAASGWQCSTGAVQILGGGESFDMIFNPSATTNVVMRLGFSTTTFAAALPASYCLAILNGTTLSGQCKNAGVTSSGSTYSAISTGTWYHVSVQVNSNATACTFTLYNMSGTVLWTDSSVTSNLPTAAVVDGFAADNTAGGAGIIDEIDTISSYYTGYR
jgi:hypothetical protein